MGYSVLNKLLRNKTSQLKKVPATRYYRRMDEDIQEESL